MTGGVRSYRVCGGKSATRSSARAGGAGCTAGRGQQQRNMAPSACRRGASATDAATRAHGAALRSNCVGVHPATRDQLALC